MGAETSLPWLTSTQRPTGFCPSKYVRAKASFTMPTPGSGRSALRSGGASSERNSRPSSRIIPIAAKKPGETARKYGARGSSARPGRRTSEVQLLPLSSGQFDMATASTPGIWRISPAICVRREIGLRRRVDHRNPLV
jgi:hypothetical protein